MSNQIQTTKRAPQTIKERKWAKLYIRLGNATEAALQVYNCKDRNSAKAIGAENLSKLTFEDLLDASGLTDRYIGKALLRGTKAKRTISATVIVKSDDPSVRNMKATARTMDFIDVPDWQARLKALEMVLKLKNKFPAEKHDHRHQVMMDTIEAWKKALGVDEQSLSTVSDVDMDSLSEEALSLSESDSEADSESLPIR